MLSLPSFTFVPGWLYVPLFNGIIFILVMTAVMHGFKGDIYRWNAARSPIFSTLVEDMSYTEVLSFCSDRCMCVVCGGREISYQPFEISQTKELPNILALEHLALTR